MTDRSLLREAAPVVNVSDVDGVATYWTERPGPMFASLHFEGGVCVEEPANRGVHHLIEHLVLADIGPQAYQYNGQVDLRTTVFHARGDVDELNGYFAHVIAGLGDVPDHRHEMEPDVLAAEAHANVPTTMTMLLSYLFGLKGPGLAVSKEWGHQRLTNADLNVVAAAHFTRQRAAAAASGDPSRLALEGLRDGPRSDAPWRLPAMIDGPGWAAGNASGFAALGVAERTTAASTTFRLLREELQEELRARTGVSYSVETLYLPVSSDEVFAGVFVDAAPERFLVARDVLLATLDEFADHGPDQRWFDLDRQRLLRWLREDDAALARCVQAASDHVLGRDDPLDDSWIEEYADMGPSDLGPVMAEFLQGASWLMPGAAPMPPTRLLPPLRTWSEGAVEGRPLVKTAEEQRASESDPWELRAGTEGISLVRGPDRVATVRFDQVAMVEAWDDGSRVLHGTDGIWVGFQRSSHAETDEFVSWLDQRCGNAPLTRMGASLPKNE